MWPFGPSKAVAVLERQVKYLQERIEEERIEKLEMKRELMALLTPDALYRLERLRYGLREEIRETERGKEEEPKPEPVATDAEGYAVDPEPERPSGLFAAQLEAAGHLDPPLTRAEMALESERRVSAKLAAEAEEMREAAAAVEGGA